MTIEITHLATGAGAFFAAVAAFIYGLKKNGYLTFGKPTERRRCADHCEEHTGMVAAVEQNNIALKILDVKLDKAQADLKECNGSIREVIGFLKAMHGDKNI